MHPQGEIEDTESKEDASSSSPDGIRAVLVLFVPFALFLLFGFAVWVNTTSTGHMPTDFLVFHGAGALFAEGDTATAYDFDGLQAFLSQEYGAAFQQPSLAHFLNPPPFGFFAQAFALLPLTTSFVVWSVVNVVLAVACYLWLELPKKAIILFLFAPMLIMNVSLGQTGSVALFVTVAAHRFSMTNRKVAAGLIAGAFLLKPPLAVGYGLYWLIKFRSHWIAIAASLGSGAFLALLTLPGGVQPWKDFVATSLERTGLDTEITAGSSFSLAEFVKPFWTDAPTQFTIWIWLVGFAAGAALLSVADRRHDGNAELLSGAAALVTVFFSPHILMYDSLILIIPVAVAYRHGALTLNRVGVLTGLTAIGVTSPLFTGSGLEFPALVVAAALLLWWTDSAARPGGLASGGVNSGGLVVAVGTDSAAVDR